MPKKQTLKTKTGSRKKALTLPVKKIGKSIIEPNLTAKAIMPRTIPDDFDDRVKRWLEEGYDSANIVVIDGRGEMRGPEILDLSLLAEIYRRGATTDGSSIIGGFAEIQNSDLLLFLDADSFRPLLGWDRALVAFANAVFTSNLQVSPGCTRSLLRQMVERVQREYEIVVRVGVEPEYMLYPQGQVPGTPRVPGVGSKAAYMRMPHQEPTYPVRREIERRLKEAGLPIEVGHSEVTGQSFELNFAASDPVTTADRLVWLRAVMPKVARSMNHILDWHPKPKAIRGSRFNGCGWHTHMGLMMQDGTNAMFNVNGNLTPLGLSFLSGIQEHAFALVYLGNLDPEALWRLFDKECEVPTNTLSARHNRSVLLRLVGRDWPSYHFEFRASSSAMHPPALFLAMLGSGMDGIERGASNLNMTTKNAYLLDTPGLPTSWQKLQEAFTHDKLMQRIFSPSLFRVLATLPETTHYP
jgi:glutamine synthetase